MKKSLLNLTFAPVLWLILGAVAVGQVKSNSPLPTQQQLGRIGLERVWWAQATLNPSRDKVKHIVVDEEAVYVQVSSGVTTAFDAETGKQKWAVQVGRFDQTSFAAVSNQELMLIVSGASLHAIDKLTGHIVWTLVLDGIPSTSPSLDEKNVYFGTLTGDLYAYSLKTIRQLHEQRRLPEASALAQVWKFKAGSEITSPPIVTRGVVNFASIDGSLYSINSTNRHLNYQLETNKPILAPLARVENSMFMASEDLSFYAINLTTGKVIWEYTSELPIRQSIWAVDRDLYLFPERGGMYSMDQNKGWRRWTQPGISNFISLMGNTIAVSDMDGNLVILTREKGEIVGSLPLRRFSVRVGNDRTDRIFLATESGLVICIRQTGRLEPVFYRYPDRLPLLPEFAADDDGEDKMTPDSTDENEEAN